MKIGATIQARMGSSRLPGKVMKPILGKPMLALQVERIQQSRLIDGVIIATSTERRDDPIERLAKELGTLCFRGSEEDILSRLSGALKDFAVELHVEFMGDSPMPDPLLIDTIIGYYLKHADRYDYVTNGLKTTYPPGMEVTVYPSSVLFDIDGRLKDPALREVATWNIAQHPEWYRQCNLEAPQWFNHPDLYLEVDTQEDLEVISAIYEHFYPRHPGFGLGNVIDFMLLHPELAQHNRHVHRRWKVFKGEGT